MVPPPPDTTGEPLISSWLMFGGVFLVASIGGLAALLRGGQEISWRQVWSALLNSGLVGLVIGSVMWSRFGGADPFLIFGVAALAGLGGATTLDLMLQFARRKLGLNQYSNENSPKQG